MRRTATCLTAIAVLLELSPTIVAASPPPPPSAADNDARVFVQTCLATGVDFAKVRAMASGQNWQAMPRGFVETVSPPVGPGASSEGWIVPDGPEKHEVAVILKTPSDGTGLPAICSVNVLRGDAAAFVAALQAQSGITGLTSGVVAGGRRWHLAGLAGGKNVDVLVVGASTGGPSSVVAYAHTVSSLAGKTIKASFDLDLERCEASTGACSPFPQHPFNALLYVSRDGTAVYDYGSNRNGIAMTPDRPRRVDGSLITYKLGVDQIEMDMSSKGNLGTLLFKIVYVSHGSTCSISLNYDLPGYTYKAGTSNESCVVHDGHEER